MRAFLFCRQVACKLFPINLGVIIACLLIGCQGVHAEIPLVDYEKSKAELCAFRDSLAQPYVSMDASGQARARTHARRRLLSVFDKQLLPAWNGTAWDFNGVSQVPREGKIACGYFITTLLRDAGFNLERAKMAQQPSLFIIRSLAPAAERKDWSYITPEQFAGKVAALPKGLYIVGLDIHTGFILHTETGVHFVHASYMPPVAVLREKAADSKVLAASKRFVLGHVDNDWLLDIWLRKEKIVTVTG